MYKLKDNHEELYEMKPKNDWVETVNGNVIYWDWCIKEVQRMNKANHNRQAKIVESDNRKKVAVWARCYEESDVGMSAFYAGVRG